MKYLLLIYHNPEARQLWESFSEEKKGESVAELTSPGMTPSQPLGAP